MKLAKLKRSGVEDKRSPCERVIAVAMCTASEWS